MPTKAREYVSVAGLGDLAKTQSMLAGITSLVRERFRSQQDERRATFGACILLSAQDVEEECLSLAEIQQFSNGVFPVLWLNLTFDPNQVTCEEVQSLEDAFSLKLLGEVVSERPFR